VFLRRLMTFAAEQIFLIFLPLCANVANVLQMHSPCFEGGT